MGEAAKLRPVDPVQLEKCILAFELLGRLADVGIPLIFKGGTAVLLTVPVPTIEGLLGDKLTAFAPTTVGILYDPESPVDIIKQLFDVGQLFDAAKDIHQILDAYDRVFVAENRYRKK